MKSSVITRGIFEELLTDVFALKDGVLQNVYQVGKQQIGVVKRYIRIVPVRPNWRKLNPGMRHHAAVNVQLAERSTGRTVRENPPIGIQACTVSGVGASADKWISPSDMMATQQELFKGVILL